jgi:hypothetical protein
MARNLKTEHAGAKNGGGAWASRSEAKRSSRKARRASDRKVRYESPFASPVWCAPEQAAAWAAQDGPAIRALADCRS